MSSGVQKTSRFIFGDARLDLVTFTNGQVWIENFFSGNKRKHQGRNCLELVLRHADEHGITLRLKARKYGQEDSPSDEQLVEIYERHGFVVDPSYLGMSPTRMIRKPGGIK